MDYQKDDEAVFSHLIVETLTRSVGVHLGSRSGILFSGGVDSSFIAALSARQDPAIRLFTVGLEGSNDISWAASAAGMLGLGENLDLTIIEPYEVESVIPQIMTVLKTADPMTISLGVPLYMACIKARDDDVDLLMAGQGADELFGGYHRYLEMADDMGILHEAITADVSLLPQRDLERDHAVAHAAGIRLAAPFMDQCMVELGLGIPAGLKVRDMNGQMVGKYILRRAAEDVVPDKIAWRHKKAFQYGSGVWAAIEKLARRAGYNKHDKGYIRKYLYSMAEDYRIKLDVTS